MQERLDVKTFASYFRLDAMLIMKIKFSLAQQSLARIIFLFIY